MSTSGLHFSTKRELSAIHDQDDATADARGGIRFGVGVNVVEDAFLGVAGAIGPEQYVAEISATLDEDMLEEETEEVVDEGRTGSFHPSTQMMMKMAGSYNTNNDKTVSVDVSLC
jgi:hypothetical protein